MSRGAWLYLLLLLSDAAWADLELHSIRLEGRNYVVAIYQPPPGRFSRVAARIVEASNTRVREAYLEHETLGPAGSGTASKLEQFLRLDERTSLVSIFRVGGDGTPDFERAQATMRVFLPDEWGQLPLDRLRKKEIANPNTPSGDSRGRSAKRRSLYPSSPTIILLQQFP